MCLKHILRHSATWWMTEGWRGTPSVLPFSIGCCSQSRARSSSSLILVLHRMVVLLPTGVPRATAQSRHSVSCAPCAHDHLLSIGPILTLTTQASQGCSGLAHAVKAGGRVSSMSEAESGLLLGTCSPRQHCIILW